MFHKHVLFYFRSHSHKEEVQRESIFHFMLRGPRPITTLLTIKPRAVRKHLPKVLRKIGQEGFKVVGWRLGMLSEEEATVLVPKEGEMVGN